MSFFTDIILWAAALAAGWLALVNLLAPLLVWRLQSVPDRYELTAAPLPASPGPDQPVCQQWHQAISAEGFCFAGASTLSFSHAQSTFRVYRHDDGMLAVIMTASHNARVQHTLEFVQQFGDGHSLNLLNSEQPAVYPVQPNKQVYRLPWLRDADQLLAAARNLRERFPQTRQCPTPGQEMAEIEDYLNREQAGLVEAGFFQPQPRADGRRGLTLKGAYFMSWRMLWPWRAFKDWQERLAAKAAGLPLSVR